MKVLECFKYADSADNYDHMDVDNVYIYNFIHLCVKYKIKYNDTDIRLVHGVFQKKCNIDTIMIACAWLEGKLVYIL